MRGKQRAIGAAVINSETSADNASCGLWISWTFPLESGLDSRVYVLYPLLFLVVFLFSFTCTTAPLLWSIYELYPQLLYNVPTGAAHWFICFLK